MQKTQRPRQAAPSHRYLLWFVSGLFAALSLKAVAVSDCSDCHPDQATSFNRSAMAGAAVSESFVAEQSTVSRPLRCLRCHAPGGGAGVACVDCHGTGPHPYFRLNQPEVCGRCHDAPGENTVRSFRSSPAAAAGQRCSDCHAMDEGRFSHDFKGPNRSGFLRGIASLRVFLRTDPEHLVAIVRIQHRAGHALPGGTTGRSVWLRLLGRNQAGTTIWEKSHRFGWERQADGRWLDKTLLPGAPTRVELPLAMLSELRGLRLELIYRFRPGPLDADDPAAVILDTMEIGLPR